MIRQSELAKSEEALCAAIEEVQMIRNLAAGTPVEQDVEPGTNYDRRGTLVTNLTALRNLCGLALLKVEQLKW